MLLAAQFSNADVLTKVQYVGSISIDACKNAKVLAEWYTKFGIEVSEDNGVYYGLIDTAAGPFVFGIHPPQPTDAAKPCGSRVAVTYKVENFEESMKSLIRKGFNLVREESPFGQFAHLTDPDGNKVSIWGD